MSTKVFDYVAPDANGATVSPELRWLNNGTLAPSIDDAVENAEEGVGIEIIITLTIGIGLFVINGVAFFRLALKKREAQKQFRKNLEVTIYITLLVSNAF